jgi:hypothetical protein
MVIDKEVTILVIICKLRVTTTSGWAAVPVAKFVYIYSLSPQAAPCPPSSSRTTGNDSSASWQHSLHMLTPAAPAQACFLAWFAAAAFGWSGTRRETRKRCTATASLPGFGAHGRRCRPFASYPRYGVDVIQGGGGVFIDKQRMNVDRR